eukprot:1161909-Pelagomonas_calceolata.AAC.10
MENLSPYPAHTCTRAHALLRLCAQGKAVADAEGSSYVGGGGSRGEESELKATMDAQLSKSQQVGLCVLVLTGACARVCAPNAAPLMPIVTRCSPDAHRMVARAVQRPWFVWWAVPAACLRDRGFVGHAMKRP